MSLSEANKSDEPGEAANLVQTLKPSVGCCGHGHGRHRKHDGESNSGHAPMSLPGLGWLAGERVELAFAILAASTLAAGWIAHLLLGGEHFLVLSLYAASYLFGGYFATLESLHSLRHLRLEIDSLMVVAAAGAGAIGHWAEGALLLTLFSLGHALEHYALGRARKSVESLGRLRPSRAIVQREGKELEIGVEELLIGDTVIVRPDSTISADGIVLEGESQVDQASITGESIPVEKFPASDFQPGVTDVRGMTSEHRVFAGTINGGGLLKIYVTQLSSDSALSRLMKMVMEAEAQRSPTQRLTDRFEKYYVPAVMLFVLVLLFAFLVIDEPFSTSFYRAMAVLVGASPCALAIATPSAVLSAVARGGRAGVLFKGGGPLEVLGSVKQIAFDKTGTLTVGKPQLVDVVTAQNVSEEQLLATAAAVERLSPHPLAKSIWRTAKERLGDNRLAVASDLQSVTGQGILAKLNGQVVAIGSEALFARPANPLQASPAEKQASPAGKQTLPAEIRQAADDLRRRGRTIMIVKHGEQFLGVLGLLDEARPAAKNTIRQLRDMGVQRMVMLSGDHQTVADAIATEVALDSARGDLMPADKVDAIREMTAQSVTAMVGDGVNDAPAMASASVAIAMGAAGSDVAMETADVALMGDDLSKLPFAVALSRQAAAIIRQNLWISLGMVFILIPAGMMGLNLAAAVVFHEGSTVFVVLNALRLLGFSFSTKSG